MEFIGKLFDRAKVVGLRKIAQWAEDEVFLPSGPHAEFRFRLDRHPIARLIFDAIESGIWPRMFFTGPNQDGKTLMVFVIIVLYMLFEREERVVIGVPTGDIARDKWTLDLLPVIKLTKYAKYLPTDGAGARGGVPETINFTNGAVLRIMTAGGDDQSRAAFTAPNVIVTETEAFDAVGSNSREGSKFGQLEKRALAYDDGEYRTVGECTVSSENGRTWYEYTNGTASRIAIPCPHCEEFVTPEREHFTGWQNAENDVQAGEMGHIVCPSCGAEWTNEERLAANQKCLLVHKGQKVEKSSKVIGDAPQTDTLGFRWTCVNSAVSHDRMKKVARLEWKAANNSNGEAAALAELDLMQAHWVLPAKPRISDVRVIEAAALHRRVAGKDFGRGVVPDDVDFITLGCDVGKRLLHWEATGWRHDGSPHVIDYGLIEVPSDEISEEQAIPNALRRLKDRVDKGWARKDGEVVHSTMSIVDCGNWRWIVLSTVEEFGEPWYASAGYGVSQRKTGEYKRVTGSKRIDEGEAYAYMESADGLTHWWEFDADYWKGWWHNRLIEKAGQPGAFTIFAPSEPREHLKFFKHNTNEKQVEEYVPEAGGTRKRWVNPGDLPNHYLDASVIACVAGHIAGNRIDDPGRPEPEAPPPPPMPPSEEKADDPERERSGWVPHQSNWIPRQ